MSYLNVQGYNQVISVVGCLVTRKLLKQTRYFTLFWNRIHCLLFY